MMAHEGIKYKWRGDRKLIIRSHIHSRDTNKYAKFSVIDKSI